MLFFQTYPNDVVIRLQKIFNMPIYFIYLKFDVTLHLQILCCVDKYHGPYYIDA